MTANAAAGSLLSAIAALYSGDALTARAGRVMSAADPAALMRQPAKTIAAFRHVARAASVEPSAPLAAIVTAFATLVERLAWQQNPNYVAAPPSPDFLDNYGYVEFAGPGRAIDVSDVRVGVLLLGPRTVYPAHSHPAEEVYHVIGGRALWWRQGQDWRLETPGAVIHHPPHMRHATACEDEPLLALYCWMGDIRAAARLVNE